jgi:hypothetical protein
MADRSELIYRPLPEGVYKQIIRKFGNVDLSYGGWISGGSVRKVWFDLPWMDQDVDYFFCSKTAFDQFTGGISKEYDNNDQRDVVSVLCEPMLQKRPFMTCYSTDNAHTYTFEQFGLSDQQATLELRFKMQAIKKYFPSSLAELFGSFDFTVCQFATDGRMMVATRAAVEDCELRKLMMVPNTPRKISVLRLAKYCAYGFDPDDAMMESALAAMANDEPLGEIDEY